MHFERDFATTILIKQCNGNVVGNSRSAEERACLFPSQPFAVVYVQVRSRKPFLRIKIYTTIQSRVCSSSLSYHGELIRRKPGFRPRPLPEQGPCNITMWGFNELMKAADEDSVQTGGVFIYDNAKVRRPKSLNRG